jgi:hypothetical protein
MNSCRIRDYMEHGFSEQLIAIQLASQFPALKNPKFVTSTMFMKVQELTIFCSILSQFTSSQLVSKIIFNTILPSMSTYPK